MRRVASSRSNSAWDGASMETFCCMSCKTRQGQLQSVNNGHSKKVPAEVPLLRALRPTRAPKFENFRVRSASEIRMDRRAAKISIMSDRTSCGLRLKKMRAVRKEVDHRRNRQVDEQDAGCSLQLQLQYRFLISTP